MGEVTTLKVPAEYVEAFRANVYGEFAGAGDELDTTAGALAFPHGWKWDNLVGNDPDQIPDRVEQAAVTVLKAARRITAAEAAMEQLGWTDPIEGDVELSADPDVLARLLDGCLVDAGDAVDDATDTVPFRRETFDATVRRDGVRLDALVSEAEWAVTGSESVSEALNSAAGVGSGQEKTPR